jgi:hypothetical protein
LRRCHNQRCIHGGFNDGESTVILEGDTNEIARFRVEHSGDIVEHEKRRLGEKGARQNESNPFA